MFVGSYQRRAASIVTAISLLAPRPRPLEGELETLMIETNDTSKRGVIILIDPESRGVSALL